MQRGVHPTATVGATSEIGLGSLLLAHADLTAGDACLREEVSVGEWAKIGMGTVVTRVVTAEHLWFGAPGQDVSHVCLALATGATE